MSVTNSKYFSDEQQVPVLRPQHGLTSRILCGMDGGDMMMVRTAIEPGCAIKSHAHPHQQIGVVESGRATLTIGDEERNVARGDTFHIPPNIPHGIVCISQEPCVVVDIFHPVRDDFIAAANNTT